MRNIARSLEEYEGVPAYRSKTLTSLAASNGRSLTRAPAHRGTTRGGGGALRARSSSASGTRRSTKRRAAPKKRAPRRGTGGVKARRMERQLMKSLAALTRSQRSLLGEEDEEEGDEEGGYGSRSRSVSPHMWDTPHRRSVVGSTISDVMRGDYDSDDAVRRRQRDRERLTRAVRAQG